MKRLLLIVSMVFVLSWTCIAQTSVDDSPATKKDVERYLQAMHSHDMMKNLAATMSKSIQQMTHEQYLKDKDNLPADYESKMNELMDDNIKNMPLDEMMEATIPAYQKHLTKGDIDNLVAFYSSPTGEKLIREMPVMMAEAMQDIMPVMNKYMDSIKQTVQKKTDEMIAQSKKPSDGKTPATHN
jgi:hypothetical protein